VWESLALENVLIGNGLLMKLFREESKMKVRLSDAGEEKKRSVSSQIKQEG
jgi:hypothetical protein